jgi:competence ComEA-like helix-hairpin-helix protein
MDGAEQDNIQAFSFVLGACVCVLLSLGFIGAGRGRLEPPRDMVIAAKINPNDAPVASLVRLPGIGPGRAEAIIAYREDHDKEHGRGRAFRSAQDLQKIKGIGPKTVENMSAWLRFE